MQPCRLIAGRPDSAADLMRTGRSSKLRRPAGWLPGGFLEGIVAAASFQCRSNGWRPAADEFGDDPAWHVRGQESIRPETRLLPVARNLGATASLSLALLEFADCPNHQPPRSLQTVCMGSISHDIHSVLSIMTKDLGQGTKSSQSAASWQDVTAITPSLHPTVASKQNWHFRHTPARLQHGGESHRHVQAVL